MSDMSCLRPFLPDSSHDTSHPACQLCFIADIAPPLVGNGSLFFVSLFTRVLLLRLSICQAEESKKPCTAGSGHKHVWMEGMGDEKARAGGWGIFPHGRTGRGFRDMNGFRVSGWSRSVNSTPLLNQYEEQKACRDIGLCVYAPSVLGISYKPVPTLSHTDQQLHLT